MADENGIMMPEEYTELSYEDGELSGSGTQRWTGQDTGTVFKWIGYSCLGILVGGGIIVGAHRVLRGHWFWQGGNNGQNIGNNIQVDDQNINNNIQVDGQNNNIQVDGQNNNIQGNEPNVNIQEVNFNVDDSYMSNVHSIDHGPSSENTNDYNLRFLKTSIDNGDEQGAFQAQKCQLKNGADIDDILNLWPGYTTYQNMHG